MYTIIETPTFAADADKILTQLERDELAAFLAVHPESGDVIPGSGGCRKLRVACKGAGKRGGSRVIYYNKLDNGQIWLLVIYTKNVSGNIPSHILKAVKEAIDDE